MDRNTIIGLVLIGAILTVFMVFNKPSDADIEAEKARVEASKNTEEEKKAEKDTTKSQLVNNALIPKLDEEGNQQKDSLGNRFFTDSITGQDTLIIAETKEEKQQEVAGELIQLETDKLIIGFSTKGGQIAQVQLKEFETYQDYARNDGKITPLFLFKQGDAAIGLNFSMGNRSVSTSEELFTVKSQSDDRIVFEWKPDESSSIQYAYKLKKGGYDLDFDVKVKGLQGKTNAKNVMLQWDQAYRKTERLLSEQRRVSTICFDYKEEGFSYLSEMGDDEEKAEDKVNWVAFKQSYFSTFIQPESAFKKPGTAFAVSSYGEKDKRDKTLLKSYETVLNPGFSDLEDASCSISVFFGPNDYGVLTSYGEGYDQILNYGWGIFRWINVYAIQPLFSLLKSTGLGIGIVIFILTLIIKSALMPVQWKMYTSSAKMRILKPEIEAINKRYPNKEDAMKKQMETMTLYRESGASPLAGCVPMLIQMPILLAVFRFFPATFDLRQKAFLWAEDLSSYDSIASIPNIPLYGDHISLFTLLMAGTTLIYTIINSGNMSTPQQEGMPNMKIIMYFFPIMMIFFFNNYSSGLSYYYFISTLISILIMLIIKRFFVDEAKLKAKMQDRQAATANGNGGKGGKSKFQERLERMQKAQQEQLKNRKKK